MTDRRDDRGKGSSRDPPSALQPQCVPLMKLATSFNVADFGVRNPLIRSSTLSPTPGRLLSRDLG